jgi:mono/diheme cytochrome c family protein
LTGSLLLAAAGLSVIVPTLSAADAAKGKELFRACASCHNYDTDARKTGPSLRTLFGKVTLRNGKRVTEENVVNLILDGYNRMPSYRYQFRPAELDDLLAFLKTLNARPGGTADDTATDPLTVGKTAFRTYCSRCHQAEGDLKGLFGREKLANGEPMTEKAVMSVIEKGDGEMPPMKVWIDGPSLKALIAYLKSI